MEIDSSNSVKETELQLRVPLVSENFQRDELRIRCSMLRSERFTRRTEASAHVLYHQFSGKFISRSAAWPPEKTPQCSIGFDRLLIRCRLNFSPKFPVSEFMLHPTDRGRGSRNTSPVSRLDPLNFLRIRSSITQRISRSPSRNSCSIQILTETSKIAPGTHR